MTFDMNKYQYQYQKDNYERISLNVKKGSKEHLKKYAELKGMKLNEYIKNLIKNDSGIEV